MAIDDESEGEWKYKHIFIDAEGTLYVPRGSRSRWDFWSSPSAKLASRFFKLDKGVIPALMELKRRADTLCIVSMNEEGVLNSLLRSFGIADWFDAIMLNGHKGERIAAFLSARELRKEDALMVGDMPKLDVYPVLEVGVECLLVDRRYNRWAKAERIRGLRELPRWLDQGRRTRAAYGGNARLATLDEFAESPRDSSLDDVKEFTKTLIGSSGASGVREQR